jgi:hypothetical protein
MFQRLKAVVPFITTFCFAAACLLSLYLPWYEEPAQTRRIFEGYSWLWKRQGFQAHLDWATLADEYLALLLAFVCLLGLFYCLQIVFASKAFSSVTGWLRRVLRLPAKAAVPLCAAYLLTAAFLAAYVPVIPPQTQSSSVGDGLGVRPAYSDVHDGYKGLPTARASDESYWRDTPPPKAAPQPGPASKQSASAGDGPWNDYAPPKQTAADDPGFRPARPVQAASSDGSFRAAYVAAPAPAPVTPAPQTAGQPVASRTWGQRFEGALRGSVAGSRLMFLGEVLLFLLTAAVYVGLASLLQRRRTP